MRQLEAALSVNSARKVLDVGCSFGYVMEAANRLGLDGAGTDISSYAVDVCRQRGYRAEVGTLEKLPFGDGEFDLVVMKHVLEHTPDPKGALAEVRRVMAPGGLVMVMVPSLLYWKAWLLRRSYRYFRPDDLGGQHYFYCTPATLTTLLQNAGATVLASSKAFIRPKGLPMPFEVLRFFSLWVWQQVTTRLFLQREAFALARW
jgi:SAM-dependent methyltransferase